MKIVALSVVAALLMLLGNPVPKVYVNAVSGEWTYFVLTNQLRDLTRVTEIEIPDSLKEIDANTI